MENSILKQDYEAEQAVFARYTAAKASGDLSQQEAARNAHQQLSEQVAARGGCYSRLYRMYRDAMECGNSDLDIDDLTQEANIPGLLDSFRAYGIRRFTFSSTWSGAVRIAWGLCQHGCTLLGMTEVYGMTTDFRTGVHEKKAAYLFSV